MGGKPIPKLNLEHTQIDGELRITDLEIIEFNAKNLFVRGPATLENIIIRDKVDLRHTSFQNLDILKIHLPENSEEVRLEGLCYDSISAGTKPEDNSKLLEWTKFRFSTQPYKELEQFFQRHGMQDQADEAFLSLKKRQCRERSNNFGLFLWTWFLILLVGYGRKPLRPFIWVLLFLCLGYFAFGNPADMIPKNSNTLAVFATPQLTGLLTEKDKIIEEKGLHHYNWFFYTLDLMLPVDIEMANYYEPKFPLAQLYARLLPLVGWIVIASLAAALTGLLELKGHSRE